MTSFINTEDAAVKLRRERRELAGTVRWLKWVVVTMTVLLGLMVYTILHQRSQINDNKNTIRAVGSYIVDLQSCVMNTAYSRDLILQCMVDLEEQRKP